MRAGVLAVSAQRYLLSIMAHDYGVVIGTDIYYGGLEDFALRDCGSGLPGDEMFRLLAKFKHVDAYAHHAEGTDLPLFLTLFRQLGRTVEDRLPGNLTVLDLYVLHEADDLASLVHI